jgi:hypothetical protein
VYINPLLFRHHRQAFGDSDFDTENAVIDNLILDVFPTQSAPPCIMWPYLREKYLNLRNDICVLLADIHNSGDKLVSSVVSCSRGLLISHFSNFLGCAA